MTNGFLPVSAKDLAQRNIKQLDFVYITGDATWIIRPLRMPSSAGF